ATGSVAVVSDEHRARKLARLMGPARSVPVLVKTLRAVLTTTTRLFGPAAIAPSGGRQPQKLSPLEIPSQPSPGVAISGPEPPVPGTAALGGSASASCFPRSRSSSPAGWRKRR